MKKRGKCLKLHIIYFKYLKHITNFKKIMQPKKYMHSFLWIEK